MNHVSSIESIVFGFTFKFFVNACNWFFFIDDIDETDEVVTESSGDFRLVRSARLKQKKVRIQVRFSLLRQWKCYTTSLPYVFSILFCRRDIQSLISLAGGKVTQANRVRCEVGRLCPLQLYFINRQGRNLFTLLTRCELKRENSVTQWRMRCFFSRVDSQESNAQSHERFE